MRADQCLDVAVVLILKLNNQELEVGRVSCLPDRGDLVAIDDAWTGYVIGPKFWRQHKAGDDLLFCTITLGPEPEFV